MIDTLMVLWTSGMWKRFARNVGAFLLLFLGICALLFLITTSGDRWSSLAVTVGRSNSSAQANAPVQATTSTMESATVQPTAAPTAMASATPYIEPIILQNPILPDRHASRSLHQHSSHHHIPPSYPSSPAPSDPSSPDNGFQDPTNPMLSQP